MVRGFLFNQAEATENTNPVGIPVIYKAFAIGIQILRFGQTCSIGIDTLDGFEKMGHRSAREVKCWLAGLAISK